MRNCALFRLFRNSQDFNLSSSHWEMTSSQWELTCPLCCGAKGILKGWVLQPRFPRVDTGKELSTNIRVSHTPSWKTAAPIRMLSLNLLGKGCISRKSPMKKERTFDENTIFTNRVDKNSSVRLHLNAIGPGDIKVVLWTAFIAFSQLNMWETVGKDRIP